jgi:probable H4MPT-linked C1 transfer pathway protein
MIFGWDIGGAHLKLAVADGQRIVAMRQLACPLWLGLDRLHAAIDQALDGFPTGGRHVITMTGEMADLFADRAAGVRGLTGAMTARFGEERVTVWGIGGFRSPAQALAAPDAVASANWHATASFLAAKLGDALLVDIGSTTSDLLIARGGQVMARGLTDHGRLASGELVYTGVVRTAVMALVDRVPFGGRQVGVMAEQFATMADVYRILGALPDGADLQPTADGRGKSLGESQARLARMIGLDAADASEQDWRSLAQAISERQLMRLESAARTVLSTSDLPNDAPLIGAGVGRFLAAELARRLDRAYASFTSLISGSGEMVELAADAAPASSIALLAAGL